MEKGRALEVIFAADVVGTLASTLRCSRGQFATQHGGFPGGLGRPEASRHAAQEIPQINPIPPVFRLIKEFCIEGMNVDFNFEKSTLHNSSMFFYVFVLLELFFLVYVYFFFINFSFFSFMLLAVSNPFAVCPVCQLMIF